MRKKFLILLFVLFTSIPWNLAFWNHSKTDANLQWFYRDDAAARFTSSQKVTKKSLKNEIKKRKKYHKLLLEQYNASFEQKTLDLISENSLILTNLRKDLKA